MKIAIVIGIVIIVIVIITIIGIAIKRGNKCDDAKTPNQENSNKPWEPTENKPYTPEDMAMQHSNPGIMQ